MEKKYLNPFLFFLIKEGKIIAWDYKNHNQFELEQNYFNRLIDIASNCHPSSSLDTELLESGLVLNEPLQSPTWGWDDLSKIFHFGTQNVPLSHNIKNYSEHFFQYINYCEQVKEDAPSMYTEKAGKKIDLPSPNIEILSQTSLWSLLKNRKTSRSFNGTNISLETLSTLLYATFGIIHSEWPDLEELGLKQMSFRKSSPSVGGLHCAEAYVFALNVDNLEKGIYHYQSHDHKLTQIVVGDHTKMIGEILCGQNFAEKLSVGIAITARFEKCWHKYKHSRALHAILIDIGHLSQTFQLCTTALQLHPWLTGIFSDKLLIDILKIKDTTEYPLFFIGTGVGDGHTLSQEMRELLK